ncbi:DUF998 domain-containing protein [Methanobrevibacter sp. TMH8]|uniref:DUF998 domain-containing protein n=1 Tax=Methanobrevibacter sp. TMH8 TaxID=2848611 RepID=UPI001CCCE0CE|nr:DUF998 domain-containing protein [Methanobrevibacter sp. TMH8]MBZ9571634.1 DUF998 domain-containing protein [Methanobrevibacter sp. TMH8]
MDFEKFLMPFGMIATIFYFFHVFLGQIIWEGYNPITTDISTLTAVGSPNVELLSIFTFFYGLFLIFFSIGMVVKFFRGNNNLIKIGCSLLLIMSVISFIGFAFFPLSVDKTAINFQNMMHIIITGIVVVLTISYQFFIAFGFLKDKFKALGLISLILAILTVLFGFLTPLSLSFGLNIIGLTERLVIFTILIYIFFLSMVYTFDLDLFLDKN